MHIYYYFTDIVLLFYERFFLLLTKVLNFEIECKRKKMQQSCLIVCNNDSNSNDVSKN